MKIMKTKNNFFIKNIINRPRSNSIDKNFYSRDQFKQRLLLEKRRAERINSKSTIIVLNTEKYLHHNGSKNNQNSLAELVCKKIRVTDSACLYQNKTFLILLPDTDNSGAHLVCDRLINNLNSFDNHHSKFTFEDLSIETLSYPANKTQSQTANSIPDYTMTRERMMDNLNLSINTYNGHTIAINVIDTFFWDQQVISNFLLHIKKTIKRMIDISGALTGLLLLFPLIFLIAILIKLTSTGPILFKQTRVGYRGKPFTFLKFRSMYINSKNKVHEDYVKQLIQGKNKSINNGSNEKPLYKIKDDERITPIGKIIRKTSLDELPQFLNVLKGDMSLVGPRPPINYEVKAYQHWHYRRILEVKPGITGLWQVSGRNRTTFDEMVRLDIQYAQNWNLLLDLKILIKTIKTIFVADGS